MVIPWPADFPTGGAHAALGAVSPNRIAEFLPRNESNTAEMVVLLGPIENNQSG